jgi:hypothetical protein
MASSPSYARSSHASQGWSRYLPLAIGLAAAWIFARGLKKTAWSLFGLYWAFHWLK